MKKQIGVRIQEIEDRYFCFYGDEISFLIKNIGNNCCEVRIIETELENIFKIKSRIFNVLKRFNIKQFKLIFDEEEI